MVSSPQVTPIAKQETAFYMKPENDQQLFPVQYLFQGYGSLIYVTPLTEETELFNLRSFYQYLALFWKACNTGSLIGLICG